AEAIFKAFARALKKAVADEPGVDGVWSSKGNL
ncbi:MAG: imidazoleglycerol-phosphate dehydratase, partial [Syntrophomonadaceae bacterium]|nr:imidazoleglycerol-phosphate dehydratase [Syntrophomonadaceae bacterium]